MERRDILQSFTPFCKHMGRFSGTLGADEDDAARCAQPTISETGPFERADTGNIPGRTPAGDPCERDYSLEIELTSASKSPFAASIVFSGPVNLKNTRPFGASMIAPRSL